MHKLLLVGQIHKPIAGGGGSHVGALQPGKVDNQCVEKISLFVFVGWNVAHPPWAATQGPICGASARVAAKRLDCSRWADIQPQKKEAAQGAGLTLRCMRAIALLFLALTYWRARGVRPLHV